MKKNNSLIYKALLKYGYPNFKLDILEYCKKEEVIKREQFYLDNLDLKYNTLKAAGSLLGFRHSIFTKEKMRIAKLSKSLSEATKLKLATNILSLPLLVKNIETKEIHLFPSIRRIASFLKMHPSYLAKCLRKNKFYEGRGYYVIIYY